MKKRIVSLGLILVLLVSLVACGKKSDSANQTNSTGGAQTDTSQKDTASDTEGTDDMGNPVVSSGEEENEDTEWTWPLSEKQEISIWTYFNNTMAQDPNELKGVQQIEENTNVHPNLPKKLYTG